MGLIVKEYIAEDCLLGIWKITETYEELMSLVNLDGTEIKTVEGFGNDQRKLEWLSVRSLVATLTESNIKIVYNDDRKPFLNDLSFNISISHSKDLTSVLLSKKLRVGIDLEYMSHRISNVAFKFINNQEHISDLPDVRRYHLYIHWCAKEALYKICDKQDINFKENLTILPFSPADKGNITGIVENSLGKEEFKLSYLKMDNYTIVWTYK